MPHYRYVNGEIHRYAEERLWGLAESLPTQSIQVDAFDLEQDKWFNGVLEPTVGAFFKHLKRVMSADLQYPVLICWNGMILDGVHRICKARYDELETIQAKVFTEYIEPDEVLSESDVPKEFVIALKKSSERRDLPL